MTGLLSMRTYPLGVGTLAIGTSGYSVTGLLPAMSAHLHTSPAVAGQLLTTFAITCAFSGPVIAVATRRWDRRHLLVGALTVAAAGNTIAAVASDVITLLTARIVTAFGTAVYTANAAAVAARINKPEHRSRAMSVVFGGLTLALLLGVPSSSALSTHLTYHGVFWITAGLCLLGALGIAVAEPAMPPPAAMSLTDVRTAASDGRILGVLAVALLACVSSFAVYTYIAVLLADRAGVHGQTISVLLAAYGIGAAFGNTASGHACDRYGPHRTLLVTITGCAITLLVLPVAATTMVGAAVTLAVWGGAFWGINPPLTAWTIELAPRQATVLLSLVGSAIYLGMGLGALVGGLLIASAGPALLGPIAGLSSAAAAVLLTRTGRPAPPSPPHTRGSTATTTALATTQARSGHPVGTTHTTNRGNT